jgi:erythromycin esterase-like protein
MEVIMVKRIIVIFVNHLLFISLICGGCSLQDKDYLFSSSEQDEGTFEQNDASTATLVKKLAHPISSKVSNYDPLMKMIGNARFVLLGEATHGTHEFYRERALITRRLIEEKGFDAVVLEADWTDAFRANEFVHGISKDQTAEQSLASFTRFPQWMWRNTDFRDLVISIRSHNDLGKSNISPAGIYGMDLYGLPKSAAAVIEYLKRVDPEAGNRAARRYACFDKYGDKPELYGYNVSRDEKKSCEKQALEQFQEMETRFNNWLERPNRQRDEELFSAYQNARVVKNGEAYYRLSYKGNFSTWNLRDTHMADTLQALVRYLDAVMGPNSKVVVWAHNTHQGDAQMTKMGESGEINVGHLMRQAHGENSVLVGFTTFTGEVMAASEWGEKGKKMKVRPAIPGSYSRLFHETGIRNFLLIFRGNEQLTQELARPRLERAIGVIYKPETERQSHYFEARMSKQFDAVIHFDVTSAVKPLN